MSHTITQSAVEKRREGRPVIKHHGALVAACEAMGLPAPRMVRDHRVAAGPLATGWAVQLPDWTKLAVFNTDTGEEFLDNWPLYGPDHMDVRSGKVRCYTGGRWGDEKFLWKLDEEYVKAANKIIKATLIAEANKQGDTCRELSVSEDGKRIELQLLTGESQSSGGDLGDVELK